LTPERDSFWYLVHAEWTKFRTVRGWVIAAGVTILAITALAFPFCAISAGCAVNNGASGTASAGACPPAPPAGPGGEPVQDAFYFLHQPLTGNGTITVQLTSLTGQVAIGPGSNGQSQMGSGLQPWSKAGIIIKENMSQGSAYAAMMVTGSHGVRMQWDYVNDRPGLGKRAGEAGGVSASAPRWLRLVRDGDTITGYDSADGTHWAPVDTVTLPGLTDPKQAGTVQAGLFTAAPSNGNAATTTGVFQHIGLSWPATGWTATNVGGTGPNGVGQPGTFSQSGGVLTVTGGSGDIAPLTGGAGVISVQRALLGTFFGLIPLIVAAAMFITGEYRRGLIRVSLTAAPRRSRLLAAKAVVIAAVGFVAGVVAAALALAVGTPLLRKTGIPVWPVSLLTEARMVAGTGALLALAGVLALAIAIIVRRSAPAITTAIVVIFVPYLLTVGVGPQGGGHGSGGGGDWALKVTPVAAMAVQQALPKFYQVAAAYVVVGGYYPLAPWAGLAVECAWAAAALALAFFLLRRRDA
jgi:ABC-type transport system involved in multi-copper enzyme maturation permease subunit